MQIPGTYKRKHLSHTSTPANLQNNCIKLSCFGFEVTKTFSLPGNNVKHFMVRKVIQP